MQGCGLVNEIQTFPANQGDRIRSYQFFRALQIKRRHRQVRPAIIISRRVAWYRQQRLCFKIQSHSQVVSHDSWRDSGPDSRNDPLAIGSDTILWSWSADRIPQTPITIGSLDRENTKPNSLLPIKSRHKSFTGKFRIEITWSWLNEKRQTDDIYSWRHNGRCGDVIYDCRYESVMASSVHAHSVCSRYNTL